MNQIVHKTFLFLLLLPTILFGSSQKEGRLSQLPSPTPTPRRKGIDVANIELDKERIPIPCRPGNFTSQACLDDQLINVRTTVSGKRPKDSAYSYAVSGGVIRGTGPNVEWDVSRVGKGTYVLTAAVKNSCGFCGEKKSVAIDVVDCPDCGGDCDCPTISVTGPPGSVEGGKVAVFTANVSGGAQDSVTYNWTVSGGEIVRGKELRQSTSKLPVRWLALRSKLL